MVVELEPLIDYQLISTGKKKQMSTLFKKKNLPYMKCENTNKI